MATLRISSRVIQRASVMDSSSCGVSGPAVNQWLTGKTKNIDPRYLADVAACTNASLNWLMTGKGDPGRRARDPLSPAEERLLRDFRRLPPKLRAEVGRLVRAIAAP